MNVSSPPTLVSQPVPCAGPAVAGILLSIITFVLAILTAALGRRADAVAQLEAWTWWRSIRSYGSCATAAIDALATLVGLLVTSLSLASLPASCSAWEYALRLCPSIAGLAVKVAIGYLRDRCGRPSPTQQQRDAVKEQLLQVATGTLALSHYREEANVFVVPFDPKRSLLLPSNMALLVEWANRKEHINDPSQFTQVKLDTSSGALGSSLPPLGAQFELASSPTHSCHSARVAAYLDCSQAASIVAVVTAGHVPTDDVTGVLDGRSLELLGKIDPGRPDAVANAITLTVKYSHGTEVRSFPVAVDVGAFAVKGGAGETLFELPCCGDPTAPALDTCDTSMLSYFDGTTWLRFVLSGVLSRHLPAPTGSGDQYSKVREIRHEVVAAEGTPPSARLPTIGDSGAPFFDSRGHLHSFLAAVNFVDGRPVRWLLVPAAAALAQLRALLGPRGYRVRGFLATESVQARAASLRGPSALASLGRLLGWGLQRLVPAAAPSGGGGRGPTHGGSGPTAGEAGRLLDEGHGEGGKKDQ